MNAFSRGTEAKSEIGISKLETNSNFQLPNFRNSVIDHVLNFVVRSFGFVSDFACLPQAGISCFGFAPCPSYDFRKHGLTQSWTTMRTSHV